jgi:hypothetical protein
MERLPEMTGTVTTRQRLAHERIRALDNDNRQRRDQIALLHGRLRAYRITAAPSRTPLMT